VDVANVGWIMEVEADIVAPMGLEFCDDRPFVNPREFVLVFKPHIMHKPISFRCDFDAGKI